MEMCVECREKFVVDEAVVLRAVDPIQNAGGVQTDIIHTAKFAGDNALNGIERRLVERLHVAGGVNLSYGAVKGKKVSVRQCFHRRPLVNRGEIICLRMFTYLQYKSERIECEVAIITCVAFCVNVFDLLSLR